MILVYLKQSHYPKGQHWPIPPMTQTWLWCLQMDSKRFKHVYNQ